jgi:hypothetical protein
MISFFALLLCPWHGYRAMAMTGIPGLPLYPPFLLDPPYFVEKSCQNLENKTYMKCLHKDQIKISLQNVKKLF